MVLPIANLFGVEPMIIVLIVVLLLFGGKKIPELMRGVGQGVGELKKGMEDGQRQVQEALRHDPAPTPVATNVVHMTQPTVVVGETMAAPAPVSPTPPSSTTGNPV